MDSTGPRSGRRGTAHPQKSVPFRPIPSHWAFRTVRAGPARRQRAYTEVAYRLKVKKRSAASQGATVTGLSKWDSPADNAPNCWPVATEHLEWFAMSATTRTPQELMEHTAASLGEAVAEMAAQLRPFPAFMGMTSLQAIELEPPSDSKTEWGCVVVLPDGDICELELEVIPGRWGRPMLTKWTGTGRWNCPPRTTFISPPQR